MHKSMQTWSIGSAVCQTKCQNEEKNWSKWLWPWNKGWCQTGWFEYVVNQQAVTPTPSSQCTEARVDAAAAININADQLTAIPRHLHKPSESGLQCWVITNSTMGKSRLSNDRFRLWFILLFIYTFLYVTLPVCFPQRSSSRNSWLQYSHGSPRLQFSGSPPHLGGRQGGKAHGPRPPVYLSDLHVSLGLRSSRNLTFLSLKWILPPPVYVTLWFLFSILVFLNE